ncbi:hypothetical protein [Roseivirga sp. E12]|uniref:hypothetical protein n=1 Tax=Roseivirga sp. E12 TaxID=2819237 RepID=UPI001ABC6A4E|nr:hypothetical protein [Roseivirga sp. E12]
MPLSKRTKRASKKVNWLFWGVFALVGLAYAYYFLIYIEDNERLLNQQSAHELQQFMQGIEARDQFFKTVAESNSQTSCEYLDQSFDSKFNCSTPDSTRRVDHLDTVGFYHKGEEFSLKYIAKTANLSTSKPLSFFISVNDFFHTLTEEHEFFDRYLILDEENVYYSQSYFQISRPELIIANLDSADGFEVRTTEMVFKQVDYKVFISSFHLKGKRYSLLGFKEKTEWLAKKRSVDPMLSIGFLIGVILLISLVPHIKVNNLSYTERLSHKDIFRVSSTLFFIVGFLTITTYFILSFVQIRFKSHEQLEKNGTLIAKSFNKSIESYDDFLNDSKTFAEDVAGINELFWTSVDGEVQSIIIWRGDRSANVVNNAEKELKGNSLGHRDYIKRANQYSPISKNPIYLEFVKSITSSNTELALSKRRSLDAINIVTATPAGLTRTNEDSRFFYQIIDDQGNIYFDSRPVNISGTLIDYTFNDEHLVGFLNSGEEQSEVMNINFEDQNCYLNLQRLNITSADNQIIPVRDYYVAAFYSFDQANQFLAASSSVTFISNLLLFLLLITIGWLIRKMYHRKSALAKKRFGFPWLLPSNGRDGEYYLLGLLFILYSCFQVYLLVAHESISFATLLIIQLVVVLLTCVASFLVLTSHGNQDEGGRFAMNKFILPLISVLLLSLMLVFKLDLKYTIPSCLLLFLTMLTILNKDMLIKKIENGRMYIKYRSLIYGFFMTSWIIAVSFLPSITFSYVSGAYENKLVNWSTIPLPEKAMISADPVYDLLRVGVLTDLGDTPIIFDINWSIKNSPNKESMSHSGMKPLNTYIGSQGEFEHTYWWVLLLFVAVVPCIWLYINVIRSRLFFYKYNYPTNHGDLGLEVAHIMKYLKKGSNCMLVGLPFSGKNKLIESVCEAYPEDKVKSFDVMGMNLATDHKQDFKIDGSPEIIIVKQLGYKVEDEEANRVKLSLLTKIKHHIYDSPSGKKPVVLITSSVDIIHILENYDQEIKEGDASTAFTLDRALWQSLLYDFYVFRVALKEDVEFSEKASNMEDFLKIELMHGRYLKGLYTDFYAERKKIYGDLFNQNVRENLILKIQEIATPYYLSLWKNCGKEERLVLYDSAEDGYLNSSNRAVINRLLKSGLLIVGERGPKLMNESFGNFILSMANSDEVLKVELEANRKGRWSTYRMITILIILSLLLFLTLAEQHMVDKALAILTAVIAIVPAIVNGAKNFLFNKSTT